MTDPDCHVKLSIFFRSLEDEFVAFRDALVRFIAPIYSYITQALDELARSPFFFFSFAIAITFPRMM